MFPLEVITPFIAVSLFVELLIYYFAEGSPSDLRMQILGGLLMLMTLFFNPAYVISGLAHVARSADMTVFEASMFGSWRDVAVARTLSLLIYMTPYAIMQAIVTYLVSSLCLLGPYVIMGVVLSIYLYSGIALSLSLIRSRTATILTSALTLFMAPISVAILFLNYGTFHAKLSGVVAVMTYVLNPSLTYWYAITTNSVTVSPSLGLMACAFVMVAMYVVFLKWFDRVEIKV